MNRKLPLLIVLALWTALASAQVDSFMFEHRSLLIPDIKNPAFMYGAYKSSLNELYLGYNFSSYDNAIVLEEGTGATNWELNVNSYNSFKKHSKIWGEAGYCNGSRKNVLWNSTADFRLLYPYVLADTVGGDTETERYRFKGGCATKFGEWIIGEQVVFRADHEYRMVDPRPRSIVTDLELKTGFKYQLPKHSIGLNGGVLLYKQTNDVSFYQELGKTPELQMSGLGADYKRFSGSNAAAYYKSLGYNIGAQIHTNDTIGGVFAGIDYTDRTFQRILTSLNSLPISKLYLMETSAELGWKKKDDLLSWLVEGIWRNEKRQGDEIIAGSPSSDEYRKLGELTMFHAQKSEYAARSVLQWQRKSQYALAFECGWQSYTSDYVFPLRTLAFDKLFGKLNGQWQIQFGRNALETNIRALYYANLRDELNYQQAFVSSTGSGYLNHLYNSATANYLIIGADGRFCFPLMDKIRMFAALDGAVTSAFGTNKGYSANCKLGLIF